MRKSKYNLTFLFIVVASFYSIALIADKTATSPTTGVQVRGTGKIDLNKFAPGTYISVVVDPRRGIVYMNPTEGATLTNGTKLPSLPDADGSRTMPTTAGTVEAVGGHERIANTLIREKGAIYPGEPRLLAKPNAPNFSDTSLRKGLVAGGIFIAPNGQPYFHYKSNSVNEYSLFGTKITVGSNGDTGFVVKESERATFQKLINQHVIQIPSKPIIEYKPNPNFSTRELMGTIPSKAATPGVGALPPQKTAPSLPGYLADVRDGYVDGNDKFHNGILKPQPIKNPTIADVRDALNRLGLPSLANGAAVSNHCRVVSGDIGIRLREMGFDAVPGHTVVSGGGGHHYIRIGNIIIDPTAAQVGLGDQCGILVTTVENVRNDPKLARVYGEGIGMSPQEIAATKKPIATATTTKPPTLPTTTPTKPSGPRGPLTIKPGGGTFSVQPSAPSRVGTSLVRTTGQSTLAVVLPEALLVAANIITFQANTACRMNRRSNEEELINYWVSKGYTRDQYQTLLKIRALKENIALLSVPLVKAALLAETSQAYTQYANDLDIDRAIREILTMSEEAIIDDLENGTTRETNVLGAIIRAYGYRLMLTNYIEQLASNGCGTSFHDSAYCSPGDTTNASQTALPVESSVSYGKWMFLTINDGSCGTGTITNPNYFCSIDVIIDLDTGLVYPRTKGSNDQVAAYGAYDSPGGLHIGNQSTEFTINGGAPRIYTFTAQQSASIRAAVTARSQCKIGDQYKPIIPTPPPYVSPPPAPVADAVACETHLKDALSFLSSVVEECRNPRGGIDMNGNLNMALNSVPTSGRNFDDCNDSTHRPIAECLRNAITNINSSQNSAVCTNIKNDSPWIACFNSPSSLFTIPNLLQFVPLALPKPGAQGTCRCNANAEWLDPSDPSKPYDKTFINEEKTCNEIPQNPNSYLVRDSGIFCTWTAGMNPPAANTPSTPPTNLPQLNSVEAPPLLPSSNYGPTMPIDSVPPNQGYPGAE